MREYHDFREAMRRLDLIHSLGPKQLVKYKFLVDLGEMAVDDAIRSLVRMGKQILRSEITEEKQVIEALRKKKILNAQQARSFSKLLTFREALEEAKSADEKERISAREVHAAFERLRKELMSLWEILRKQLPFEVRET